MNKALLLLVLFSIFSQQAFCATPDEYWISYTSLNEADQFAGAKFLMKIDASGNVLIPPRLIVPESKQYRSPRNGATALFQDDRSLILFAPAQQPNRQLPLFRAVIDKKNLKLVSFRQTRLVVNEDSALQVTHRKNDNFLVFERLEPDESVKYLSVPLSPEGNLLSTEGLELFPERTHCPCEMGISTNGRIFFFRNKPGIDMIGFAFQRLNHDREPVGSCSVALKGSIFPGDITDRLVGDRIFAIYHQYPRGRIRLMVLNADTLERVGNSIGLDKNTYVGQQKAVIDPDGRFVLYITDPGHPAGDRILMFQTLDAQGQPSGKPKRIADMVQSGLDLLKDRKIP